MEADLTVLPTGHFPDHVNSVEVFKMKHPTFGQPELSLNFAERKLSSVKDSRNSAVFPTPEVLFGNVTS